MSNTANSTGLRLNYRRTFLTDIFARRMYGLSSAELKAGDPDKILNVQWLVGIIMACDNLAALILLPIFGRLSDKTKTPIGKRMPYILVGTLVSAVASPSSRCSSTPTTSPAWSS